MRLPNRRLRILLGLLGAVALVLVLVAPIALRGGSGGPACAASLRFAGRSYTARRLEGVAFVQAAAIGAGVVSGCGGAPANVDVRSVAGVPSSAAVALPTETDTLYVARGRCEGRVGAALLGCLRG